MSTDQEYFLALRVVVGITCVISICGASVIILTYVAFKDLRTLARLQLVNLSLADIVVAASHMVGLIAERVENYNGSEWTDSNSTVQPTLCRVQAGFTMCGSIASFLWSLALGLYMLMIIVLKRPEIARYMVFFIYYPVCWGLPLALTLWFALVNPTYLGFAEGADVGWCYLRIVPGSNGSKYTVMAHLLGYGLWFYITVVALAIIYLTMLFYLKFWGIRRSNARRPTDLKLILIPFIFLLLRVWSTILDTFTYYTHTPIGVTGIYYTLIFIAGIGDSAQGLANAILFCVFTKQVRQKLLKLLHSFLCCCCRNDCLNVSWRFTSTAAHSSLVISHETTTQLDSDSVHSWTQRGDQLVSTDELSNSQDDRTALLKGSCNQDPYESDRYGTTYSSTNTNHS